MCKISFVVFLGLSILTGKTLHGQIKKPKVLMIGIDGCRFDAILYSQAKLLKEKIKSGAYSDQCDVLDRKGTKADTASGSGWSTILTGVWADRHRVLGNDFKNNDLQNCPSILQLLQKKKPQLNGLALVTWKPIKEFICKNQDGCHLVLDGDLKGYKEADKQMATAAVNVLQKKDPDLLFIYFGHTDSVGHGYGFHPKSPKYTNGIEEVDGHLRRVFNALQNRSTIAEEDWLTLIFTDHGGQGRGHGGGRTIPEMRNGFLIVHGDKAAKGRIESNVTNVDIVPTALAHLGIELDPSWRLEGKAVGLKSTSTKAK